MSDGHLIPNNSVKGAIIAGVDESGRGSLIGEVYVCAVVLDPFRPIEGLDDSKKLTVNKRGFLDQQIRKNAMSWSISTASLREIEQLNVLGATLLAMKRAVETLDMRPDKVMVDGNQTPDLDIPTEAIIKGDSKFAEISAASIMAKVARDRAMVDYHHLYPEYGFNAHKGYLTQGHLDALLKFGPCPVHRKTFAPVRTLLESGKKRREI